MAEFEKDMVLQARGRPHVKVKVLSASGRIQLERITGGPVGVIFRLTREQVRVAYEPVKVDG